MRGRENAVRIEGLDWPSPFCQHGLITCGSSMESRNKRNRTSMYFAEAVFVIVGLLLINAVFFADAFRGSVFNPVLAGQLGDFVGGYMGSTLVLFSVVFIFSTLRSQMRASEVQEFTDKYYQLISIHQSNVSQLGIGKDFGRKVFVILFREFRAIYDLVDRLVAKHAFVLSPRDKLVVSYYVLFFGAGPRSSRMLEGALSDFDQEFVGVLTRRLADPGLATGLRSEYKLKYKPFDGHQSRLGHYYRHLYQTVTHVDSQMLRLDKYGYVKTVRAQLSNHEQVLLLLNALTPLGRKWFDEGLLQRYRLVKNIPRHFFTREEIDLAGVFPPGYFEWEEQ